FTPSSTAPELFHPRTGDDLDGWNIKAVEVIPYNFSAHAAAVIRNSAGASTSAPGDPWPINPANKSVTPFTSQLWTEGVNVVITVGRISDYYIIVAILPIAVNVWLCLLVFFISPRHLDTRLGVVVTMFLSLTAIQFVISGVLPSSSTVVPTQQLVIVSYAVLAIIGIMSIAVYFIITADRQRAKRERSRRASRAFTQRWTTFVGGVGSASAAGVDAAAAAATASSAVPVSPGLRQPGTPPAAARLEQQGLLAGDSATAAAAAAADGAGGPLGTAAASGGGALQGSWRGAGGESGASGGADKDHVRFAGLGMCGATPDDDKGDSDESDDGGGDNKSYAGTDSEADSEPPFREGRADGKRGVRWEDGPDGLADSPLTNNNNLVTAGGDGKDGSSCVLTPDRGEGPFLDLEAGVTRVPPPPLPHEQQEQQPRRSISLEVDGSRRRRARACFACCSVPWWRAVLLAPWRWLTTQQLKLKEMMREAEQNKEYAEHLARSLDRVVFWVVLLGYNVAIVIIFAIGAQDQPSYAFERPDD
ncbi:hypothetical protein N2152v2_000056, partial [Parachlorella kessleri]